MSHLAHVADVLSCSERTLRRAATDGLIRVERESERKQRISFAEQRYLRSHWPLLRDLRAAMRTERDVRLAVLFGSMARGDDHAGSDVDVAVDLRSQDVTAAVSALEQRLGQATGRRVDVLAVAEAREHPMLWSEILLHGRPLVDRTRMWSALRSDAVEVAGQADHDLQRRARSALERIRNP